MSYQQRSLAKRFVFAEARIEILEQELANGKNIDPGKFSHSINTLVGLARILGLKRKTKHANLIEEIANHE